jgi:hypothetical protein
MQNCRVSGVAAASTAAAMVISMNKERSGNGSIGIHHLHEMREGEARTDGDGEMHNAVEGILEETIVCTPKSCRRPPR